MRRIVALASVAGIAFGIAPFATAPASACDPNRFPNCMTYCGWVAWRYRETGEMTNLNLPPWPHVGEAGCP